MGGYWMGLCTSSCPCSHPSPYFIDLRNYFKKMFGHPDIAWMSQSTASYPLSYLSSTFTLLLGHTLRLGIQSLGLRFVEMCQVLSELPHQHGKCSNLLLLLHGDQTKVLRHQRKAHKQAWESCRWLRAAECQTGTGIQRTTLCSFLLWTKLFGKQIRNGRLY